MPLTARGDKKSPPIPEGVYVGVAYAIFDLGTQYSEYYEKSSHKILVCWEIPEHRITLERDGQKKDLPRAISQRYTLSLGKKANLRRDLEAWRGKAFTNDELEGFDVKNVLGKACQIQVVHNTGNDGNTYANVGAIMALPKGMNAPEAENPLTFFSFEDDTSEPPEGTPEWVMKVIEKSAEWQALNGTNPEQDVGATEPPEQDEPVTYEGEPPF